LRCAELFEAAAEGNRALGRSGVVVLAIGNLSVAGRHSGLMAIKPSGADYQLIRPDDIRNLDQLRPAGGRCGR